MPRSTSVYGRPALNLPRESCVAFIARHCAHNPNGIAIRAGEEVWTWFAFGQACAAASDRLVRSAVQPGTRVAVALGVEPDYVIWTIAALARGATVVPIYPNAPLAELESKIRAAQAATVIVPAGTAKQRCVELHRTGLTADIIEAPAWRERGPTGQFALVDVPDDAGAFLPFSSGSTGEPKGILLSHRNALAARHLFRQATQLGPDDIVVHFLPLAHVYGWMVATATLEAGATLVLHPRYDFDRLVADIERYRATALFGIPQLIVDLGAADPSVAQSVASLRYVNTGSAPQAPEFMREVAQRMRLLVTTGYGLTEAAPLAHSAVEHPHLVDVSTVGFATANTELRLVDPDDPTRPAEFNKPGELVAYGPQVSCGYIQPDGNLDRSAWLPDGGFRTGDLVTIDNVGRLRIVGRLKNIIKYKGYSIAPPELEALLALHPNTADCAVIGRSDPVAGEIPTAFIVPKDPAAASPQDVLTFMRERLSPQKVARSVVFVESIPRSVAGKVIAVELLKQN